MRTRRSCSSPRAASPRASSRGARRRRPPSRWSPCRRSRGGGRAPPPGPALCAWGIREKLPLAGGVRGAGVAGPWGVRGWRRACSSSRRCLRRVASASRPIASCISSCGSGGRRSGRGVRPRPAEADSLGRWWVWLSGLSGERTLRASTRSVWYASPCPSSLSVSYTWWGEKGRGLDEEAGGGRGRGEEPWWGWLLRRLAGQVQRRPRVPFLGAPRRAGPSRGRRRGWSPSRARPACRRAGTRSSPAGARRFPHAQPRHGQSKPARFAAGARVGSPPNGRERRKPRPRDAGAEARFRNAGRGSDRGKLHTVADFIAKTLVKASARIVLGAVFAAKEGCEPCFCSFSTSEATVLIAGENWADVSVVSESWAVEKSGIVPAKAITKSSGSRSGLRLFILRKLVMFSAKTMKVGPATRRLFPMSSIAFRFGHCLTLRRSPAAVPRPFASSTRGANKPATQTGSRARDARRSTSRQSFPLSFSSLLSPRARRKLPSASEYKTSLSKVRRVYCPPVDASSGVHEQIALTWSPGEGEWH